MSGLDGITEDRILGDKVTLFQSDRGFRAGTDSVLLGASIAGKIDPKRTGKAQVLEFGSGAGAALFTAAHHLPGTTLIGVERDKPMADLALRGIQANGLGADVSIVHEDASGFVSTRENVFDLVFSNPPYFEPNKITAPGSGKESAYLESLPLEDWIKAMLFATRPRGHVVLIHRAVELSRILARLDKQAGDICVFPIRGYAGKNASRVLVSARKGLKSGPATLHYGLNLHTEKGGPLTPQADAILRGGPLNWE